MSSTSSRRASRIAFLERSSLAGMTLGVATMLQPWWRDGMRAGFFVAAACTLAQIVLSHWPQRDDVQGNGVQANEVQANGLQGHGAQRSRE